MGSTSQRCSPEVRERADAGGSGQLSTGPNTASASTLNSGSIASIIIRAAQAGRRLLFKWFSPTVAKVVYLIDRDIGRPIAYISHRLKNIVLPDLVEQVLDTLSPLDQEVCDEEGRWYDLRVTLYRTELHAIGGTVVSLSDISEIRRAKQFELFHKLLESSPDATVIADASGGIYMINKQAEELFGWNAKELMGRPVEMLLPERYQKKHQQHREMFLEAPQVRTMGQGSALKCRRKDGSEFFGQISLSPIETEMGTLVYTAIRDVSAQKQTELTLRRTNGVYQCLEQLEKIECDGSRNVGRALQRLCRELLQRTGYTQCWISLKSGKGKQVSPPVAHAGLPKGSRAALDPALSKVLGSNKVTVIRDILTESDHSDLRPVALEWKFRSLAFLPVMNGKRVLGTLCLHALEPSAFDEMELNPLRVLSRRLSCCFTDKMQ